MKESAVQTENDSVASIPPLEGKEIFVSIMHQKSRTQLI
jgi:hypothetical protein